MFCVRACLYEKSHASRLCLQEEGGRRLPLVEGTAPLVVLLLQVIGVGVVGVGVNFIIIAVIILLLILLLLLSLLL